jgi:hypothetical protein
MLKLYLGSWGVWLRGFNLAAILVNELRSLAVGNLVVDIAFISIRDNARRAD